jgi:transcriptional regulator with XRE-family HTH domain
MIGYRLKEERERLGLTQEKFASLAGVQRRTLVDWEKGVSSPTALQLSKLADAGADASYIVTGRRSADALTPTETVLVDNYRHTSKEGQDAIKRTAFALAKQEVKSKAA